MIKIYSILLVSHILTTKAQVAQVCIRIDARSRISILASMKATRVNTDIRQAAGQPAYLSRLLIVNKALATSEITVFHQFA